MQVKRTRKEALTTARLVFLCRRGLLPALEKNKSGKRNPNTTASQMKFADTRQHIQTAFYRVDVYHGFGHKVDQTKATTMFGIRLQSKYMLYQIEQEHIAPFYETWFGCVRFCINVILKVVYLMVLLQTSPLEALQEKPCAKPNPPMKAKTSGFATGDCKIPEKIVTMSIFQSMDVQWSVKVPQHWRHW